MKTKTPHYFACFLLIANTILYAQQELCPIKLPVNFLLNYDPQEQCILTDQPQVLEAENPLSLSYPDERRYDEVCWLTAHNAFASTAEGWYYAQQELSINEQFAYGVRSFMVDFHWAESENGDPAIALCHESPKIKSYTSYLGNCLVSKALRMFKAVDPATYFFDHVYNWLQNNPEAIITVHIESHLGENSSEALSNIIKSTGLEPFIYHQNRDDINSWPTLGELRARNKRLIIFSDNPTDGSIFVDAYLETQYNLSTSPNCEMREEERATPDSGKNLFVMNHFFSVSSLRDYETINAPDSILKRLTQCYKEQNRLPNFLAVDFIEKGRDGGAREIVKRLNELLPENFRKFTENNNIS